MADSSKPRMSKIKSGVFSRGFALARMSMNAGAKAAGHAVGTMFSSEDERAGKMNALISSQMTVLAKELGQLKGTVMKIGQGLSMYGEHFLPPEANAILKSLQSQSPPLEWSAMEKQLKRHLGAERIGELEIDPEPWASASLGQVHRARRKSDGIQIALKIQYPGVDQAIEGDLKAMRSILSMSKIIPRGPNFDEIFAEVKQMMHQEVDYARELESTKFFREALKADPRFVVPEVFPEYSSSRVLATSFEEGVAFDSAEVAALSQERRNALGIAAQELYFTEIFRLGVVQSDPHFGNYRIRLGDGAGKIDQLVLLDFGAVRKFPKKFLTPYHEMVQGVFYRDEERLEQAGRDLGFLQEGDSPEQVNAFMDLCFSITEPFFTPDTPGVLPDFFDADGAYDFGRSDLPKRAVNRGKQFAFDLKLRPPPREVVFLDRKMGGLFIMLSVLRARVKVRPILERYLAEI